jgi:SH3-like domain-containing protein
MTGSGGIKKIKILSNIYNYLTKGWTYEVIQEGSYWLKVVDDNGIETCIDKDDLGWEFMIVE